MIIDILDWDLTYDELVEWISQNDITLDAINGYSGVPGASTKYVFRDEEDFIAFKLKFAKESRHHKMGYTGITMAARSYNYCPYIPVIK